MPVTPTDAIWFFFLASALQPVLRQRFLEAARQRLIAKIERDRKSRVILLIHRQETMSLLGFPVFRYIDVNDSEDVLRAIHMTDPEVPIDIILHTPGGLVLASMQIARALHKHKGKVTAFVPHYAMSGGTLIALAADEIVMSEYAVLGPVDPQLGQYPAASILKVEGRNGGFPSFGPELSTIAYKLLLHGQPGSLCTRRDQACNLGPPVFGMVTARLRCTTVFRPLPVPSERHCRSNSEQEVGAGLG